MTPRVEQTWSSYAVSLLIFNAAGAFALYALFRLQYLLPLNAQNLAAASPDLSLDIAISFVSNTSWQSYAGETTLSYLAQMIGIAVQSFLSAATGMAVAMAADPRPRPAHRRHDRQFLDRPDARRTLHPAADLGCGGPVPDIPRRTADAGSRSDGTHDRGRYPDDRAWPCRQPGGDQAC